MCNPILSYNSEVVFAINRKKDYAIVNLLYLDVP